MDLNTVTDIDGKILIRNVLASTADKRGLPEFAEMLLKINPEITIYSTGGTYKLLSDVLGADSRNLRQISSYTGQPEMQGGLVKTLDFKIYLGLLSETYNDYHQADLKKNNAVEFDLVAVNLYPFQNTVAGDDCTLEMARSNIDIGGPCMLRASAKNFLRVASVCNPDQYTAILKEMEENRGSISLETRLALAKATFRHTAEYDTAISAYLNTADPAALSDSYTISEGMEN